MIWLVVKINGIIGRNSNNNYYIPQQPRVGKLVGKSYAIFTHYHVDHPLTKYESNGDHQTARTPQPYHIVL